MAQKSLTPITLPANPTNALEAATKQYVDSLQLTTTSNKTLSYTAAANEFVLVDTTAGAFTLTLPAAPPTGTMVGVRHVLFTSGNNTGVNCSGTDVFNRIGGAGTATNVLIYNFQGIVYLYGGGVWSTFSFISTLGIFDLRDPELATLTAKGDIYAATASGAVARQGVGANGTGLIADSSQTNGVAWGPAPLVFASTTARDTAITSPTVGMTCITTDTGSFWQYFTGLWYRPNTVLTHVNITANTSGIGTGGTQIVTSGSITVPANRRIICALRVYCEFLNNGGWMLHQMDGGTADQIARTNQSPAAVTLYGEAIWTPSAGAHTWTILAASLSGTMNVRGDQSPSWFQVRDYGPV